MCSTSRKGRIDPTTDGFGPEVDHRLLNGLQMTPELAFAAGPSVDEWRGRLRFGRRSRSHRHDRTHPPASSLIGQRANLCTEAIPRRSLSRHLHDAVLRAPGADHRRRGSRDHYAGRHRHSARLRRQRMASTPRNTVQAGSRSAWNPIVKKATRCRFPMMAQACRKDTIPPPAKDWE